MPLSIAENGLASQIKVYPNPFENAFRIEGIEGALELSVYNAFGQLVHKEEVLNGNVQMDLPAGIYFLNIQQVETGLSFTAKVIRR